MLHPQEGKYNYSGICKLRGGQAAGASRFSGFQKEKSQSARTRKKFSYFCVGGAEGFGAGAGWVFTGCDFTPCNTEVGPPRLVA